jgi:adenylate cyclase
MERRLAAILAADVVGYSRLVRADEEGTIAALKAMRAELVDPRIAKYNGRVVKLMGDGMLAEFASVVDAVRFAADIQRAVAARNGGAPADKRIDFRVGINLGDVVIDGDDIHGDGVNVAARLETMAEPGGICISGAVYEQVRDRLDVPFRDLGEQPVKNIDRPVRVWQWTADGAPSRPSPARHPAGMAKPAIAVLPFDDLSNDPENEAIADGLTEDIITALSRTRWYDVTARNSTFAYKGQSPDVRDVARALGVRYVLEGSVRKAGNRARITAQLIDAVTGNHVWADRFDRALDDLFALQDEIAHRVATLLQELVWQDVAKKVGRIAPEDYGAHEHTMAGIERLHRLSPAEVRASEQHFLAAIGMDPDLPLAHQAIGLAYLVEWTYWGDPQRDLIGEAARHAQTARRIAPNDAMTYRLLSRVALTSGAFDEAKRHAERALKLNADDSDIVAAMGVYETFAGDAAEGRRLFEGLLEVHSETPHSADIFRMWMAIAQLVLDDPAGAKATLRQINGLDYICNLLLAACEAALDHTEAANDHVRALITEVPDINLERIGLLRMFRQPEHGQKLRDAIEKAGLPEG